MLVAVQWVWRPLRPWVRHYAPLLAGAVLAFCLWDLITLKLDWMTLPYFPGPDEVLAAWSKTAPCCLRVPGTRCCLLVTGYAVGVTAGLVSRRADRLVPSVRYWGMPVLKILGPLPATALVPLVMTLSSQSFCRRRR